MRLEPSERVTHADRLGDALSTPGRREVACGRYMVGPTAGGDSMDTWLVVPCYNEASRWNSEYWRDVLQVEGVRWLFVDDGSSDETLCILQGLRSDGSDGSVEVLQQPKNRGKAEAVRAGLLSLLARGDVQGPVGFMDADGAFEPADIRRLVSLQTSSGEHYEAVWSSRVALAGRAIHRSIWRHYVSRAIATVVCWRDPTIPYDTQSGFKIFEASPTLSAVLREPLRTRWMFEPELLARWKTVTGRPLRVWEEPLTAWSEVAGSHLRGRELLRISRELVTVKVEQAKASRRLQRRPRPLPER